MEYELLCFFFFTVLESSYYIFSLKLSEPLCPKLFEASSVLSKIPSSLEAGREEITSRNPFLSQKPARYVEEKAESKSPPS